MSFSLTDLGLRQPRLEGEDYLAIVDEFMEAVHARWPKAIVQVQKFPLCDYLEQLLTPYWFLVIETTLSVWGFPNEVGIWNASTLSEKVLYV